MTQSKGIGWYKSATQRDNYWFARAKNRFAVSIERLMEHRGIKRKDLAERLGNTPASVSKVLRGDANLTIETMVKLVRALDADVSFQVTPSEASIPPWLYMIPGSTCANDSDYQDFWKKTVDGGTRRVAVYQ